MESLKIGDQLEVRIESLSYGGGRGVGRVEGCVIFVPYTAPGDLALVRIIHHKKNHAEAELVHLIEPSAHRIEPSCPVFSQCGGCKFQHISYSEQLNQKNLYIQRALRFLPAESVRPILPSPRPMHYRNRIQVHIRDGKFGYLKMKSNQLIPIQGCPIAEKEIHHLLGEDGFMERLNALGASKVEVLLDREERIQLRAMGEASRFSQFAQVNRFQNEKMVDLVVKWAELLRETSPQPMDRIYDLYAGSGNLSFPLARQLQAPVTAVELSSSSVTIGLGLKKAGEEIEFVASSVKTFLNSLESFKRKSLVVTDPPREGLGRELVSKLAHLQPMGIVHIGCDLMKFSRDLGYFVERGYRVEEVQPLDMFPQTDHVELVARLSPA